MAHKRGRDCSPDTAVTTVSSDLSWDEDQHRGKVACFAAPGPAACDPFPVLNHEAAIGGAFRYPQQQQQQPGAHAAQQQRSPTAGSSVSSSPVAWPQALQRGGGGGGFGGGLQRCTSAPELAKLLAQQQQQQQHLAHQGSMLSSQSHWIVM